MPNKGTCEPKGDNSMAVSRILKVILLEVCSCSQTLISWLYYCCSFDRLICAGSRDSSAALISTWLYTTLKLHIQSVITSFKSGISRVNNYWNIYGDSLSNCTYVSQSQKKHLDFSGNACARLIIEACRVLAKE